MTVNKCVGEAAEEVYYEKDGADWCIDFSRGKTAYRCARGNVWRTMLHLLLHVELLRVQKNFRVDVDRY